ncbi:WD40 repeat and WD40/YVTN repeat-like-containing domain and WD40-repeat-containing domain-containing protein [Strongyloides ratti]|uniref:tRNA (34-2'-O)-methyltransferase regulator WDR6 n=1 Tax=Strongyloides ratti TaxID=34506 RepID=A0A090KX14_STRRB|nr:WD40 repeat and WD40/YVTN repeat-like-containing domain and WD40-repeat-containing domain-containing protein [Strongyloides ratti]CEF61966.1 WD40 repeat and WD40/YVTN repeat-like-containing domain and WD40-repeat-containing domain-containing protein [Strongyloides ratti]
MTMHIVGPRLCSYKKNADTLLVGNASIISIYKRYITENFNSKVNNEWNLHQQVPVFVERGYNIHGIFEIDKKYLIVYGEKAIAILKDYKVLKIRYYRDWILSAFCVRNLEVILHFSTNSITILNIIEEDIVTFKTKYSASLDFSTVALCSLFISSKKDECHLFVGTCFGQILMFEPLKSLNVVGRFEGHHGMVFAINFVNDKLYSIGDDRSFRCWNTNNQNEISCSYGHEFRPFSIAYCEAFDYHLTAGGDEMVCIWKWYNNETKPKLVQKLSIKGTYYGELIRLQLNESILKGPSEEIEFEDDKLKIRGFNSLCNKNEFVIISSNGEVSLYNHLTKFSEILLIDKDIRSDSLVISGSKKVVTVCTKDSVYFINIAKKNIYKENFGKTIMSTIWSDNSFFLSFVDGTVIVYNFSLIPCKRYNIQMKPPTQITSALIIPNTSYIFIGQKNGCFFYINGNEDKIVYEPKEIFIYAHDKEAILDIYVKANNLTYVIYTIGKDGLVRTWFFNPLLKSKNVIPRTVIDSMLEWPNSIYLFQNELYVGGFHAKYFRLFHLETGTKICEFECGGGHRAWNGRFIESDIPYFDFSFISKGKLNRVKLNCNFVSILDNYLHTLQITTICAISPTHYLTGSVDTNIVLSEVYNLNNNSLKKQKVLQRINQHISTVYDIKCIKEINEESTTIYVISVGGKGEILFWKCCTDEGPTFLSHLHTFKFDEDLRILGLQVMVNENITSDIITIPLITILSDGSIKLLEWNIKNKTVVIIDNYIEDVNWMYSKLDKINNSSFASIGTDGNLYIFEIATEMKIHKVKTIFIERAGLSSLAAYNASLICVGSESGTLHIIYQGSKVTEIRYHASTLTGITVIDANKLYHIFSVSLDCRIGHYIFNSGFGSVGFENGKVLSISDPSNIIFNKKTLISIGAGVEHINIDYFIKDFVKK